MDNFLVQTNSSKLTENDFDKILDFGKKFSESVIFQDTEARKLKLFEALNKTLELQNQENSNKL